MYIVDVEAFQWRLPSSTDCIFAVQYYLALLAMPAKYKVTESTTNS